MMFVSITRLRLRSPRYLPGFLYHSLRTFWQIRRADGNLAWDTRRDKTGAFWTRSVWRDQPAMRAFMSSGAHARVMPRLLEWASEASVAHWEQEGAALPSWAETHQRMRMLGRPSKVKYPTPAHATLDIPEAL